ncbi:hypothetical protein BC936DRAFT_148178 [Jimgerdemannia flammicorona]|uniref:NADAR domain-containing protein n=1 Tax=Jimgerdemannia flammicorona TaxID=994334 RepID=A0A433D3M0_9FUNG|nr:hypothetical protein BC936DRAFT_148178 [Jimgerdemannia flammicorona]
MASSGNGNPFKDPSGQHNHPDNEVRSGRELPTSGENLICESDKDRYGVRRGTCSKCECPGYHNMVDGLQCQYCSHVPIDHEKKSDPGAPTQGHRKIKFYERNAPYYEFTNFQEGYPIKTHEGKFTWLTSEHLFQAQKFTDPKLQKRIREAPSPRDAFNVAQANKAHQRSDWLQVNVQVMYVTVREKFIQHPDLKKKLLDTGDAELIEHTANDAFWGDGGNGTGKNELGKCLMKLRDELRRNP